MKKLLILNIIVILPVVWFYTMNVPVVEAGSCQCQRLSGAGGYTLDCHNPWSQEDCNKEQYRLNALNAFISYSCKYYADDKCSIESGSYSDANNAINPCWNKDQCLNSGGQFDNPVCTNNSTKQCDSDADCPGGSCKGPHSPQCNIFAGKTTARCFTTTPPIQLEVAIPGVSTKVCNNNTKVSCSDDKQCLDAKAGSKCVSAVTGGFAGYMASFYKFFIYVLAICAVTMTTWGGFKRIMAAGSAEKIKDANDTIYKAIIGLVLALISYSLLNLINPKLVSNSGIQIDKIKQQQFGDWCPDPDPSDNTKHYSCGDHATVDGKSCIGLYCEKASPGESQKGCWKTDVDKYECLQNWEACAAITDDNVKQIHGEGDEANDVHTSACANYTDSKGRCLWTENSGATAGFLPITLVGMAGPDDRCIYISEDLINAVCGGGDFQGKHYDAPNNCHTFNNAAGETTGLDWSFCYYDLCKKGCWAKWKGAWTTTLTLGAYGQVWWCKDKSET